MATSPDDTANTMIANLKAKTGKTLEQWIAIAKRSDLAKHGQIVKVLKADHGMTHGFANLVAHKTLGSDAASKAEGGTDLVAAQYAGDKAALMPIYDALIKSAAAAGEGVEVAPKRAYVSLRRSKQFALIQPSTKTRVDLGLNLPGQEAGGRLEASGSFNAMVTHRVRLEKPSDVDKDVQSWIKAAWSQA